MIEVRFFILVLIVASASMHVNGQVEKSVRSLPKESWSNQYKKSMLSAQEKMELLSLLSPGDSVQFSLPNYDPDYPDEARYFPLDTAGLVYMDLDFDGDLDLIYSGQSGWQTLYDCKVYINKNNSFQYHSIMKGKLLDVFRSSNNISIYTMWVPCCDSYTTRIEKYNFSVKNTAVFDFSISAVGLKTLRGYPGFTELSTTVLNNPSLFASPEDFRRTSPYFRERTRSLIDSLRNGYHIKLIELEGTIRVNIIDKKVLGGDSWNLVITEPIDNVPKSLYEWSSGSGRRLIGWVMDLSSK